MGEGTVFSLFVSPHLDGEGGEGGAKTQSGLDGGGGGGAEDTPARSWWLGGGITPARSDGGGLGGGTPSQVWWWGGYPIPGLDGRGGTQGTPQPGLMVGGGGTPSQVWMVGGTPSQVWMVGTQGTPHHDWMGYPPHQHSKHLLRGGWYSSCVHAGGLSSCT